MKLDVLSCVDAAISVFFKSPVYFFFLSLLLLCLRFVPFAYFFLSQWLIVQLEKRVCLLLTDVIVKKSYDIRVMRFSLLYGMLTTIISLLIYLALLHHRIIIVSILVTMQFLIEYLIFNVPVILALYPQIHELEACYLSIVLVLKNYFSISLYFIIMLIILLLFTLILILVHNYIILDVFLLMFLVILCNIYHITKYFLYFCMLQIF